MSFAGGFGIRFWLWVAVVLVVDLMLLVVIFTFMTRVFWVVYDLLVSSLRVCLVV